MAKLIKKKKERREAIYAMSMWSYKMGFFSNIGSVHHSIFHVTNNIELETYLYETELEGNS